MKRTGLTINATLFGDTPILCVIGTDIGYLLKYQRLTTYQAPEFK
jgi:hypothetical protein